VSLPSRAADRGVDRARARAEATTGKSQVDPFDVALPNLLLKRRVRLVVPRYDQQAAGVLVEAVDDSRPLGVLSPAEDLRQLIDQGRAGMGRGRVDDEPGWLVDNRE
jgi:hypothetical protein